MQNRRSAQKCRLKKKEEFGNIKSQNSRLNKENTILNEKVSWHARPDCIIAKRGHYDAVSQDWRKPGHDQAPWVVSDAAHHVFDEATPPVRAAQVETVRRRPSAAQPD